MLSKTCFAKTSGFFKQQQDKKKKRCWKQLGDWFPSPAKILYKGINGGRNISRKLKRVILGGLLAQAVGTCRWPKGVKKNCMTGVSSSFVRYIYICLLFLECVFWSASHSFSLLAIPLVFRRLLSAPTKTFPAGFSGWDSDCQKTRGGTKNHVKQHEVLSTDFQSYANLDN